jgi:hypothetical protein
MLHSCQWDMENSGRARQRCELRRLSSKQSIKCLQHVCLCHKRVQQLVFVLNPAALQSVNHWRCNALLRFYSLRSLGCKK